MDEALDRIKIVEKANELFYYTDTKNWGALAKQVFAEYVFFDITSLGGEEAKEVLASEIISSWETGLSELDAVHHQAGNYLVDLRDDIAKVICYATASHYKEAAKNGTTRTFVGSYELGLVRLNGEWRINGFTFSLKYMTGNIELN